MPYSDLRRQRAYQREWMAKRRADYFADKVCATCGATVDLRLDHMDPFQKVSHNIWSWRQTRREAELAKCQVLCADCHLEKTQQDGSRVFVSGEAHPFHKFTEEDIRDIRELASWRITRRAIANMFNVTHGIINRIVHRQAWAYLDAAGWCYAADRPADSSKPVALSI